MTHGIRPATAGGERRGRPELPGLLVAQKNRFTGWIADGIVSPGREPVLVAAASPRVAGAAFRSGESERRMGDDVRPRNGRKRAGILIDRDDVLASFVG